MTATLQIGPDTTDAQGVQPALPTGEITNPFILDQELTAFGTWAGTPIWVPPKDSSTELAKSMLKRFGLFASKSKCWSGLINEHRSTFTQVREIELSKASIRLPQGKLFVSITEREHFDKITDKIPNCVQTRLEEFLAGPGKQQGVKVYYLKPLCVEVGDDLIFTTDQELNAVITKIQREVFSEYRRLYLSHRPGKWALRALNIGLAVPRKTLKHCLERKKRAIDAYQAQLEFNRRKIALRTAELHRQYRTDGCTFNDIISLTKPPGRVDVIDQYAAAHQLSNAQRNRLLMASAVTLPWFVTIPAAIYYLAHITITIAPPVMVCDPAFVAEMPGSKGVVLKIGHFDEVRGVTHVEI